MDERLREEAGSWCLALAHRRLQLLLPLVHGSVSGAIRFLDESQATAAAEMEVFHQGHDAFLRLQQALPRFEHLRELHTRSLVQRQCVLQVLAGCREGKWRMTSGLRNLLGQRFSRIGGAQVNRDGLNFMKTKKMMLNNKKERRAAQSGRLHMSCIGRCSGRCTSNTS